MGDADWRAPCRKILNVFKADPQVVPFLEPVPWKELNLFDYPKVVKKPMAISTIERSWNKYKSAADFARDRHSRTKVHASTDSSNSLSFLPQSMGFL